MKFFPALIVFAAIAPLSAQTTTQHTARPAGSATAARSAGGGCAKLPELSPKIPALPAGLPCPKALYTITNTPGVKLDYISPLEGTDLKADLGIEPTSFSLDYVDTKIGTGELAGAKKWYTMNYTLYLADGTEIQSSVGKEPLTFPYGQHHVIPGWDTGLAGMHVGGKRRLFIPFELAYGANPPPQSHIPPRSMLIFDVELLKISDVEPKPPTPPAGAAPVRPQGSTTPPQTPPGASPARPATVPPASGASPKP